MYGIKEKLFLNCCFVPREIRSFFIHEKFFKKNLFHFDVDNGWTFEISWNHLCMLFAFFVDRRAAAVALMRCHVRHLLMRMDAVMRRWVWHSFDFHLVFGEQIARIQCVIRRRDWAVCGRRVHFNHWLTLWHTHVWLQVVCGTSIVHCRNWCAIGEQWRWDLAGERARRQRRRLIAVHLRHGTIDRWRRILGMNNGRCDRLMQCSGQVTQFYRWRERGESKIFVSFVCNQNALWTINCFQSKLRLTSGRVLENGRVGGAVVVVRGAAVIVVICAGILRTTRRRTIIVWVLATLWLALASLNWKNGNEKSVKEVKRKME